MDITQNIYGGFCEGLPYIYLSFAQEDSETAEKIAKQLRSAGFNIYRETNVSLDNAVKIQVIMQNSEAVVFIVSENSSASISVKAEMNIANILCKNIYLLQIEKVSSSADMTLSVSGGVFASVDALIASLPETARIVGDEVFSGASVIIEDCKCMDSCEDWDSDEWDGGELPVPAAPMPDPMGIPMPAPMPAPMPPTVSHQKVKQRVRVKPQPMNKVDFSVLSPDSVKPGNSSIIDVFMYTKKQRRMIDDIIKRSREKVVEAARTASNVSVRQGSAVTVVLSSEDAVITDISETLMWNGDALDFKFRFTLPDDYKKKQVDFSCGILFDGIHISRLYFSVKVNAAKSVPIKLVRKDSREAFVSYSHKDKQRVIDHIYAIQEAAPKMRFWMDNQSMTAGDNWRSAIASAIKSADVFLLFWSANAKASSEVRKEWQYALQLEKSSKKKRKGGRFISPVPLDHPSLCPPPAELGDLHFGDPSFDSHIDHIDEISFVGKKIKNIRKIK